MQIVWGAHRADADGALQSPILNWTRQYELSRRYSQLINEYGGNSEVVVLPDIGLEGNSHVPFMDNNNDKVADLLEDWLAKHKLAGYARSHHRRWFSRW